MGVLSMWRISLIILICLFSESAYSTQPTPAPAKAEQKDKERTKDNKQSTSTDQRGTENYPLFIKAVPPLRVAQSPSEHQTQSKSATSPEWALVWVTLLLAGITAILAAYTAKLWNATRLLAEDGKQTAERQAREMQESLRIARESSNAAKESVDLARQEFIATHRPKIIVRRVRYDIALSNAENPPIQLHFSMANTGETPAVIVGISVNLVSVPTDILPASIQFGEAKTTDITINTGEHVWHPANFPGQSENVQKLCMDDGFGGGKSSIHCLGYIIYKDAIDRRYRTGFVRRYNPSTKRFDFIGDLDYEYQD